VRFEQNAAKTVDAIKQLTALKEAAEHFARVLDTPVADASGSIGDVSHFVEGLVNDYFEHRGAANALRVSTLSKTVWDFQAACNWVEQQIRPARSKTKSVQVGRAWREHFIPPLAQPGKLSFI
jgi:hypothetical protein